MYRYINSSASQPSKCEESFGWLLDVSRDCGCKYVAMFVRFVHERTYLIWEFVLPTSALKQVSVLLAAANGAPHAYPCHTGSLRYSAGPLAFGLRTQSRGYIKRVGVDGLRKRWFVKKLDCVKTGLFKNFWFVSNLVCKSWLMQNVVVCLTIGCPNSWLA